MTLIAPCLAYNLLLCASIPAAILKGTSRPWETLSCASDAELKTSGNE